MLNVPMLTVHFVFQALLFLRALNRLSSIQHSSLISYEDKAR